MNAKDTARLCGLVATVCPQQRLIPADEDEGEPGTAGVWFVLLQDLSYEDAVEAVQRVARRQPFIAPAEIVAEVKQLRAERLDALPEAKRPTPNVDPRDKAGYRAELVAIRDAIADGRMTPENVHVYGTPVRPTISGAQPLLALTAGPEAEPVTREIDLRQVFADVPKPKAEQRAKEADDDARRKAHAELEAWEKRRKAILKRKAMRAHR